MSEKEIYEKIVEVVQSRQGSDIAVSPELSLKDGLGADSVDLMELVISLEDAFDLEISDEEMDHFDRVSDIVAFVHEKVK